MHFLWPALNRKQLSVLLFIAFTCLNLSALPPNGELEYQISLARGRLQSEQPTMPPAQLTRLAEEIGRSNYVAVKLLQLLQQNDGAGTEKLLADYKGNINELQWWNEPVLAQAVRQNKPEIVDAWLRLGASPNVYGSNHETPLFRACQSQRLEVAERLLDAHADVNATNAFGMTALGQVVSSWWGRQERQLEVAEKMLVHGADAFLSLNKNQTSSILESALGRGDPSLFELLLTNQPSPLRRTPDGDTALHVAASKFRTNLVDVLLASRFSIDQTNSEGLTALQMMSGLGLSSAPRMPTVNYSARFIPPSSQTTTHSIVTIARALLDRGATLDVFSAAGLGLTNDLSRMIEKSPSLVNARDGLGRTPLHYASAYTNAAIARLLIDAGADLNAVTTKAIRCSQQSNIAAGATALHVAVANNSTEVVRMLLTTRARAAIADINGNTPLHIAAAQRQTNESGLLIDHIVPLDVTNNSGATPLHLAVESGAAHNVALLFKAGAKPITRANGKTLLHEAAERGATEILPILLASGLNLEARDGEGCTPLMSAITALQWKNFSLLLNQGADINVADAKGNTALHRLSTQRYEETWHEIEQPYWIRTKQRWNSQSGLTGNLFRQLVSAKLVAAPPPTATTNSSVTEWVLRNGANVNATNQAGDTALDLLLQQDWIQHETGITNRLAAFLKAGATVHISALKRQNLSAAAIDVLKPHIDKLASERDAEGRTLLHWAVEHFGGSYSPEYTALASALAANQANINVQDANGYTPLHLAFIVATTNTGYDIEGMTRLLMKSGANPNIQDKKGRTALHIAATQQHQYIINRLRSEHINDAWDLSIRDNSGNSVIHLLAENGDGGGIETVRAALTNSMLANLTNATGDTPLHLALEKGESQMVELLLKHGADVKAKNLAGITPLYLCAISSYPMYQYLRPAGAKVGFFESISFRDKTSFEAWLEAEPKVCCITNSQGKTGLQHAAEMRLPYFVERLRASGAEMDLFTAIWIHSSEDVKRLLPLTKPISSDLMFASVLSTNQEALESLAAAGGDLNAIDNAGHSLFFRAPTNQTKVRQWLRTHGTKDTLFDAVESGDIAKVTEFLNGDDQAVNRLNHLKRSPLIRAIAANQKDIVALLLARGAFVSHSIDMNWTALHVAAARGFVEIGEMLLKRGADVNASTMDSLTPLHIASANGHADFVKMLLSHGASLKVDVVTPGYVQNTPLHWATLRGHVEVVKILLEQGADLTALNTFRQTAEQQIPKAESHGGLVFYSPPDAGYTKPRANFDRETLVELFKKAKESKR